MFAYNDDKLFSFASFKDEEENSSKVFWPYLLVEYNSITIIQTI